MMRLAGTLQAEDRVARGGELVDQFAGGRAAVEGAGVGLFEDHHAGALDARIVGFDGGGHEVGEPHVGDEAAALLDLEHGLLALVPLGDAHLAAEHAGLDADVGDGLGEAEGAAPRLAVLAGLGGGAAGHVVVALLGGAAFVDGGEREASGQAAGGGAGVHPGEFERDQRQRQVLGTFDEAALRRDP